MALTDLVLPSSSIQLDDVQSFTVNALSFKDVEWLVNQSLGDLDDAVEFFRSKGIDGSSDPDVFEQAVVEIMSSLINRYPELTARIIACASGDRGEGALLVASKLPVPVMADALMEIFRLTFSAPGGVKKFVENVTIALKTFSKNLPKSPNVTNASISTGTTS